MKKKIKFDYKSGLPSFLKTKIEKTNLGRAGSGIYNRHNPRDNRVIMHLSTYKTILQKNKSFLDNFKNGYAVRLKPEEYFVPDANFPPSLVLGFNTFIYIKSKEQYETYDKFCKKLDEVWELRSQADENNKEASWIGSVAYFVNNPKLKVSHICDKATKEDDKVEEKKKWREKFKNHEIDNKFPGRGLGNYDIDYASEEVIKNTRFQLSYLIWHVKGMFKQILMESPHDLNYLNKCKKNIQKYCDENQLLDFKKLASVGAWDLKEKVPTCPLCLAPLQAKEIFQKASQVEGREEEDNTSYTIELMHIESLTPGKLNHRCYNLGWGHKICNMIQGPRSIDETYDYMNDILKKANKL